MASTLIVNSDDPFNETSGGDHLPNVPAVDDVITTEIWFKGKRVLRTAVQVILSAAGVLAVIAVVAPQVLDAVADVVPGPVLAWLAGAIAFLGGISAALTRVMAIPAVNAWLTNFGLGSVPADKITS